MLIRLLHVAIPGLALSLPLAVATAAVIETEVCVYGGAAGGVTAAVQAKRLGKSIALVVFNNHLGGLSSGGLGQTDVGSNGTAYIQGLAREFYTNPHFPALRSDPMALSGASRKKQSPGSNPGTWPVPPGSGISASCLSCCSS
jgi:hypothetical protein